MVSNVPKVLGAMIAVVLLSAIGWCGAAVAKHLYDDHVLIDQARDVDVQRLRQAAEQLQQMQKQQQAAPAAAAPAK